MENDFDETTKTNSKKLAVAANEKKSKWPTYLTI